MVGLMDLVTAAPPPDTPCDAVIAAAGERDARERCFRTADDRIGPHRRREVLLVGAVDGILDEAVLVADHARPFDAPLPVARVAREERHVATTVDEVVECVAHRPTPVLVVTDAEIEATV